MDQPSRYPALIESLVSLQRLEPKLRLVREALREDPTMRRDRLALLTNEHCGNMTHLVQLVREEDAGRELSKQARRRRLNHATETNNRNMGPF